MNNHVSIPYRFNERPNQILDNWYFRVSIPYRFNERQSVSIPYRFNESSRIALNELVSIPYRFNERQICIGIARFDINSFQFLIGSMKDEYTLSNG